MNDMPADERLDTRQVVPTLAALRLIERLRTRHGELLFYQSGGCCDGSVPMCYAAGDFMVGDRDIKLGEIGGAPFYLSQAQFGYWKHTQLIVDATPGRGSAFSLDNGEDMHFLLRSRLFSDAEYAALEAAGRV